MSTEFTFAHLARKTKSLEERLLAALETAPVEPVRDLAERARRDLEELGDRRDGRVLTLAFVGQYNAGKSTIITALTGRRDIRIDADVTTDKVAGYDWHGRIRLLDTPGIHAGFPDHDEETYAAIAQADLLVFVVTSELFDDLIGQHFRCLAFEGKKAREILLVVNKMSLDPGTPETKLADLAVVTKPLTPKDFGVVFMDALAYLEAQEADDPVERKELEELSGFREFERRLQDFVESRGLMGRLTTPLFVIRSLAIEARQLMAATTPEEQAAIQLLAQERAILLASKQRLHRSLRAALEELEKGIVDAGSKLAEAVHPGTTTKALEDKMQETEADLKSRYQDFTNDVETAVSQEIGRLIEELEELSVSSLANTLRERLSAVGDRLEAGAGPSAAKGLDSRGIERIRAVLTTLKQFSDFAKTAQETLARAEKLTKAVKTAKMLQNAGRLQRLFTRLERLTATIRTLQTTTRTARVLGRVGKILIWLGPFIDIATGIIEKKMRRKLQEARSEIRAHFAGLAKELRQEAERTISETLDEIYGQELRSIDEQVSEITDTGNLRRNTAQELVAIAKEATELIKDMQNATGQTPHSK